MIVIHENDDLWYALRNNPPSTFKQEEIEDIIAEVPGENDELTWWWILKLNKGYALVSGSCDYTGWDCQSYVEEHGIFETEYLAAMVAPDNEEYSRRNIKKNLLGQITGEYPKFTYWE